MDSSTQEALTSRDQKFRRHNHNGVETDKILYSNISGAPTVPALPVSIANGGTGQTTASAALSALGGVSLGASSTGQFSSNFYDNGIYSSSGAIDWNKGNRQKVKASASITLTFSNPISGATYTLMLIQDSGGSRAWTLPTIKWPSGTPPLLSTAANAIDIITLVYDGSNYFGTYSLAFS